MARRTRVSESVTSGHPDKISDLIADTVLDHILERDPDGRVACEVLVKGKKVILAGEITTTAELDANLENSIRETIKSLGYTPEVSNVFNYRDCELDFSLISKQSPDIARGVDNGGAGDQGFMIGYAVRETLNLMPLPIYLAHRLTNGLTEARERGVLKFLRPDGKSQVSVIYENGIPIYVDHITIAAQHSPDVSDNELKEGILEEVVKRVIPSAYLLPKDAEEITAINRTGRFVIGGPEADAGVTGRKLSVDTYGGRIGHGGGALSGKDPTKVDRSASYMTRHIAKNLVLAGFARECAVQVSYEIGNPEITGIDVETFGTSKLDSRELAEIVRAEFSLRPRDIIDYLRLRRPIFKETTNQPFGRNGFTWEDTNKSEELWAKYKDKILFIR